MTNGLEEALKQIREEFGDGAIMDGSSVVAAETISTGVLALDNALSGGIARGAVHEIFGTEGAGKTTLTYSVLSEAQKLGKCAFIDAEHAMDRQYAEACGLDVHGLLISQPSSGEEGLEIADKLVRSGEIVLVVVDSVAALTPKAELEGAMGDQTVGAQARMMGQAMRKLVGGCRRTGTTIIFINQIREKVGGFGGGSPEVQPGGRALKFFAGQRLDVRKRFPAPELKRGDQVYGHVVKAKIIKNKIGQSATQCEFDIIYGKGVSKIGSLVDVAVAQGAASKSGSHYTFGATKGHGKEKFIEKLVADQRVEELREALEE